MHVSSNWSLPFIVSDQNVIFLIFSTHATSAKFYSPNMLIYLVKSLYLSHSVFLSCLPSLHFLRYKYYPPVVKYPPTFMYETKFHSHTKQKVKLNYFVFLYHIWRQNFLICTLASISSIQSALISL